MVYVGMAQQYELQVCQIMGHIQNRHLRHTVTQQHRIHSPLQPMRVEQVVC